jgi:glycosyltransferase involved in cell wall biosynthesis
MNFVAPACSLSIALYNLTTTTKVGGVESFVWDLSRELSKRGHRVTIIGGVGERREPIPTVRVIPYPFISRGVWQTLPMLRRAYAEAKLLERLSMAVAALPLLIQGGFDIIHIQKPYDMAPALLARWLGGARVVLGCHGEDFYRGDRALARHMDAVVACSAFNAQTVGARYTARPIRVIYNGFDATRFCPQEPDRDLRQAMLGKDSRWLVLYVGRLMPWKGVDTALQALVTLPATTLLIAGDGEERERLHQMAIHLGVAERVRFLGVVPRQLLPRLYSTVDLLVATSFASETFGISLVEAQACGLPVVATRFGGFPEVVDEGRTGVLVPPRDSAALATALQQLLAAPDQRAAMAAAAPGWAAQFVWDAVVDRVEAAYSAALGQV